MHLVWLQFHIYKLKRLALIASYKGKVICMKSYMKLSKVIKPKKGRAVVH